MEKKRKLTRNELGGGFGSATGRLADDFPHRRDALICFRERDHCYATVYEKKAQKEPMHVALDPVWDTDNISTTTIIGKWWPPFDRDGISLSIAKRRARKNGLSVKRNRDIVKEEWNDSGRIGTLVHLAIERFLNTREKPGVSDETMPYFTQFLEWLKSRKHPLRTLRTEMLLFTDKHTRITGAPDAIEVLYVKDEVLYVNVLDWKTFLNFSRVATANMRFTKRCWGPFKGLIGVKEHKVEAQLNMYKKMLETYYTNWPIKGVVCKRVVVVKMYAVIFNPGHPTFRVFEAKDRQPMIEKLLTLRAAEVAKARREQRANPLKRKHE